MTWGNPPAFVPTKPKKGKLITPEQLAASGSEDGEQAALFCWSALNVGTYPGLIWLHAIPNGGSRHTVEAMNMVAAGLRSGVWDIFLPWPRAKRNYEYHGLYIEMKVEKRRSETNGGLSDEQVKFQGYAESVGYYCKVCYGWEEARDTLVKYLEGKL